MRELVLVSVRLLWWTITGQLERQRRILKESRLVKESRIFDAAFYQKLNPEAQQADIDPLSHYLAQSIGPAQNPHPLFDNAWYSEQSTEVRTSGLNPLVHYLTQGWKQGLDPHPLFDTSFYLDQNPDVALTGIPPLQHYITQGAFEGRNPHLLFDSAWYSEQSLDVRTSGLNPLVHYLTHGWKQGLDPHPLFDTSFYLDENPGVALAGIPPLQHYITQGAFEGRDPHPLFNIDCYLRQSLEIAVSRVDPLVHYLESGWKAGLDPHPLFNSSLYAQDQRDLPESGIAPLQHYLTHRTSQRQITHHLFDANWYLLRNTDVAASGLAALVHYLLYGWKEGRDPHPLFDTTFYVKLNPEVANAGISPLQHYVTQKGSENHSPHSLFSPGWYLKQSVGAQASRLDPLIHYLIEGWKEGLDPHPLFDSSFYLEQSPNVAKSAVAPLVHYVTLGAAEGRDPHPLFKTDWYVHRNAERLMSGINPLLHYLQFGWREGCDPHPLFDGSFFLEQNRNVEAAHVNPLLNYVTRQDRGRDPNRLFDSSFYLEQYPDAAASPGQALVHYITTGAAEGRSVNRWSNKQYPRTLPTVYGKEEWNEYGKNRLDDFLSSQEDLVFPQSESAEVSIVLVFHNNAHLSLLCLDAIKLYADMSYELVIVDNGSTDESCEILDRCHGPRIIRNVGNRGFGEACMQGAAQANGKILLFLNNDTLLEAGAIGRALRNFDNEFVGAVGGKILLPTCDLQEAGCILWSDGFTDSYGRNDQSDKLEYNFKRPVDYCSGAFVFTPRALFFRLGGFDPAFGLGYYEDVDYCLKVWETGMRVIYDPSCVIRHFENASSGGWENGVLYELIEKNRRKIVSRWKKALSTHCASSANQVIRARISSESRGLRILYLDHCIPARSSGGPYSRGVDILNGLVALGSHVSCAALSVPPSSIDGSRDLAEEIELIDGTRCAEKLYRDYLSNVDLVWIRGEETFGQFANGLTDFVAPSAKIVCDFGAIYSENERQFLEFRNSFVASKILAAKTNSNLALVHAADAVIVQSKADQVILHREGLSDIFVVGHSAAPTPTPARFIDRTAFLFVRSLHRPLDQSVQALTFLCDEVWPELRRLTQATLIVVGFGSEYHVSQLGEAVKVVGAEQEIASIYNKARVYIGPARHGAGIPFEVQQAAIHGVPAVVSDLVSQQLGWEHGVEALVAQDAASFLNYCYELYNDEHLWRELRKNALSWVVEELNPGAFKDSLSSVLNSVARDVTLQRAR